MTASELIGTNVSIPGSPPGYGTVRYIGEIQGKSGVFVGIELHGNLASTRGKNSGFVNGIEYFHVKIPGSGLFLPYDRLRTANPGIPERSSVNISRMSNRSSIGGFVLERRQLTPELGSSTPEPRRRDTNDDTIAKLESEISSLKRIIQDKDKRLDQFAVQRQEWRAAMDELVSVQQDGIEVFEVKIHELEVECNSYKQEIERLNSELALSGLPNNSSKELAQAKEKIVQLEQDIENLLSKQVSNVDINNSGLQKQIDSLKSELESRPKMDNLLNLQKELDELDSMYHEQLQSKDQQIKQLEQEVEKLKRSHGSASSEPFAMSTSTSDELPIYQSSTPVDPSSGKNDWP
ncbi:uncharacterized protein SPAPADRAFT_51841 [Spathaspora passalidarum NRRL Y-27907]|uniref:CAP-Gly domain-containing protein n=1 Tax=Spathaspora passalidarum (strain NRRL Y-27907 / 11-Y1) TaxID=619300 RepID=G3AS25_SPAPN|nr:uncharacterized protein SPAPADRAFT_51841 [Spathaspora passalidarum NRRL Y-27907]EGW31874.1 hypothetical protein SPAPADRAFT_51841 [Spathaspora passalidarum NRRL Y-27907]